MVMTFSNNNTNIIDIRNIVNKLIKNNTCTYFP